MTIHERIEYIAKNIAKSRADLARKTGYAQKIVDRYAKGETKDIPVDFISAVARAFPKIRLTWLVLDEGEMLRSDDKRPSPPPVPQIDEDLLVQMADLLEEALESTGKTLPFPDKVRAVRQLYELARLSEQEERDKPQRMLRVVTKALAKAGAEVD